MVRLQSLTPCRSRYSRRKGVRRLGTSVSTCGWMPGNLRAQGQGQGRSGERLSWRTPSSPVQQPGLQEGLRCVGDWFVVRNKVAVRRLPHRSHEAIGVESEQNGSSHRVLENHDNHMLQTRLAKGGVTIARCKRRGKHREEEGALGGDVAGLGGEGNPGGQTKDAVRMEAEDVGAG